MKKGSNYRNNYTYGSVAYDMQPEVVQHKKTKTHSRQKSKNKYKFKLVFTIGIIAAISFLILSRFAAIIKTTYDIRGLKNDIKAVQMKNDNIKVEIAKMNNIRKIEEAAIGQYGMVIPQKHDIIYVDVKPLTLLMEEAQPQEYSFIQKLIGFVN